MKKIVIFVIFSLLVLAASAAVVALRPWERFQKEPAGPAETAEGEPEQKGDAPQEEIMYVVSEEGLALRDLPGVDGERLGLLSFGARVTVFHRTGQNVTLSGRTGQWVKVRTDSGPGWVFGGWLEEEQPKIGVDLLGLWLVQEVDGSVSEMSTGDSDGTVYWRWDDIGGQFFFEFNDDGSYSGGRYATGCGEWGQWTQTGNILNLGGTWGVDSMEEDEYESFNVSYRISSPDEYHVILDGDVKMLLVRVDSELETLCREGKREDLENFAAKGGSFDVRLMYDNTPLFFAVLAEDPEKVRFLLEQGIDVNARNIYGMTALHAACEGFRAEGMLPVVQVLLEYGADPSLEDNEGQTPPDKLGRYDNEDTRAIQALLGGGAGESESGSGEQ